MRPGAKLAKKWVFPQCNLLSEVLLFSRTVLSAIQRSWKKNSLIVIGKTPGNNLAPNWNTCMKLDATKWENIGIMWWAQKDGVHFLKRLWNKVQQLGDGFNTIHQESVHLMWSLKMHISASLQWLMKFSRKIAFNKANRRMKWMLKTNNIFYVWAIRLGLAWCGLSIFGRLMKVKTFFFRCHWNRRVGNTFASLLTGMLYLQSLLHTRNSLGSSKLNLNVLCDAFIFCAQSALDAKR